MVTLPDYPRLSPGQAELGRIFGRRRAGFALGPLHIEPVKAPPAGNIRRQIALGRNVAVLDLPHELHRAILDGFDPAWEAGPGDLACLLLEAALAPWTKLDFAVLPDKGASPDCLVLGFACRGAGLPPASVRLELDAGAAAMLAPFWDALPPKRHALPDLTVALQIRALATDLPLSALRALNQGDVILADVLEAGGCLLVAGERLCWCAAQDGGFLTVTTNRLSPARAGLGNWMVDALPSADETEGATPIGELPIRLTFELGRLEVRLDELEVIGPGHVFSLAAPATGQVDILANGRRVGRGRIVDIAGEAGVQVVWIGRHE